MLRSRGGDVVTITSAFPAVREAKKLVAAKLRLLRSLKTVFFLTMGIDGAHLTLTPSGGLYSPYFLFKLLVRTVILCPSFAKWEAITPILLAHGAFEGINSSQ